MYSCKEYSVFKGSYFLQAIIPSLNLFDPNELEKLFDKRKKTSGELVVVEKLFRFYFPFIRHGDLNQQPFYKILYWGLVETDSDPSKDPVTVEEMIPGYSHWYDRRTKSAYPSTDKKFFARMCFDLNQ